MNSWHSVDRVAPGAPPERDGVIKGFCYFDGSTHPLSQDTDLPVGYHCTMPQSSVINHTGFRAYLPGRTVR